MEELISLLNKKDSACYKAIQFYQQGNKLAAQLWKRISNYYDAGAQELMSILTVELCMTCCFQQ